MLIKFAQSARKHRIAKGRALHVMSTAEPVVFVRADGTEVREWIGADDRGLELEVVAVQKVDRATAALMLLVIHVMPTDYRKGDQ